MEVKNSQIEQSENVVEIIGTLKEINLKRDGVKSRTLKSGGTEKTVNCDAFVKKSFRDPAFVVESNGNLVGVDISFDVNQFRLDYETKEVKDNTEFKAIETIMNYEPNTRVRVKGSIVSNEYVDKSTGKWTVHPAKIKFSNMSSTSVSAETEDKADCMVSGIIQSMRDEFVNEVETGRLLMTLYAFDYNGATFPIELVADKDIAEGVKSTYEVGQCANLFFEPKTVTKGRKIQTVESAGFGRKEANITSGYNVTEYSIFNGSVPFDEENPKFVSAEQFKIAKEERNTMIAQKEQEKANKTSTPSAPSPSSFATTGANKMAELPF